MTHSESPSDTLRRAAGKVRELAAEATPGPWGWHTYHCNGRDNIDCPGITELVSAQTSPQGWPMHPLNVLKVMHESWVPTDPDAAWIAALNPAVAEPLAAWLELEAGWDEDASSHSVDFARALLGEDGACDA